MEWYSTQVGAETIPFLEGENNLGHETNTVTDSNKRIRKEQQIFNHASKNSHWN